MVTLVQPHGTSVRWRRSAPWSGPARRQALYLAGGIPAQLAALVVLLPWAAGLRWRSQWFPLYWPGGAGKLWPLTPIGLAVVFLAAPALTAMHRHRLRSTAGVQILPPLAIGNRWSLPGIVTYVRSRATWRQLGYHFLAAPAIAVAAVAVIWVWLAGILYTLVYVYASAMQRQGLLFRGRSSSPANSLPHLLGIPVDVYLTVLGIVLLAAAPRLTAAVCALDARAARALLGPSRAEELQYRVGTPDRGPYRRGRRSRRRAPPSGA
jgi:Putative sensor